MDARTSDQSAPVGQPSYGISITHGPDTTGKWWIMITVQSAAMSFTYGVPLDTALDFIPFVGGLKNAAEVARGRDFIRDRRT